jgi:GntR family transcriptional regulator
MDILWNDKEPIYRQLQRRLIEMVIDGVFADGDALPSVRQISTDLRINPITVSKAYQLLVDEGFVEKRRGLGMFVATGAHDHLVTHERNRFLTEQWPNIIEQMHRLGLSLDDLPSEERS